MLRLMFMLMLRLTWFWCWWRHPNKGDIAHRALNIYATCFPWYTLSFQCYDHPDKLGAWQEFDFSSVCSCQNGIDTLFCLKQTPQSSFADVLNITKKQFLTWWQPLWNFISVGAMVGFLSSLSTKAVSLLIVVNWNNTWRLKIMAMMFNLLLLLHITSLSSSIRRWRMPIRTWKEQSVWPRLRKREKTQTSMTSSNQEYLFVIFLSFSGQLQIRS